MSPAELGVGTTAVERPHAPASSVRSVARRRGATGRLVASELALVLGRRRNRVLLVGLGLVPLLIGVMVRVTLGTALEGQGPGFVGRIAGNGLFLVIASLFLCMPFLLPLTVGIASGDSVAGEASAGTLRYLLVVPVDRTRLLLVKALGALTFAAAAVLTIAVVGLAVGAALFLFVVLGLGVFISTVSQNAGQAIQLAFFFMLPQILLSGMIFPLDAMAAGVRWIAYVLPLTYFTMISQGVMLRGASLVSLWLPFLMLTLMAIVVFSGATLRFRRDLAPGRRRQHVTAPAEPAADSAGLAAGPGSKTGSVS